MASICCCPPDMAVPGDSRRSCSSGNSAYACSSRAAWSAARRPRAAMDRFSSTESRAKIRRPSMQCAMPRPARRCGGKLVRSSPSNASHPAVGRTLPAMVLANVYLHAQ